MNQPAEPEGKTAEGEAVDPQPNVRLLHAFGRDNLAEAGGKGANLGELIRAGFEERVPPGFVVTTSAYDRLVAHNHLDGVMARALSTAPERGAAIRAAFEAARLPLAVEQEIVAAYEQLGQGPVAVRSSATAEDLPGAAFAGQQDTYLNIVGKQPLLDAVRRCWASLWTDRAIAYRSRQQVDQATVKLAVVVQRLVPAEVAGVLFTANPISGARDEVVVDASPGLGEAIVSGLVTPDHFVLEKHSGRMKEQRLGRREVMIRARAQGGTEHVEQPGAAHAPVLSGAILHQLAQLGTAIENHFGTPQDIEWAWAGGELFILQARPMTALPEPLPPPSKSVQMLAAMYAEMFPVRPYPLDQTTWVRTIASAAVEPLFGLIGIGAPSIAQMLLEEDGVVTRFSGTVALRLTPTILLAPWRLFQLAHRYDPAHAHTDPMVVEARKQVGLLNARDLSQLSWEGLLATVREALALVMPLTGEPRRRYYPRALLAAGLLRLTLGLLGRGNRLGALLSGAESMTLEANHALETLAARIRSQPTLADIFARYEAKDLPAVLPTLPAGQVFLAEFQAFLDRFGHREVVLSTVLQPTWQDAPELVLGLLKGLALTEPRRTPERAEHEVARDNVLAHLVLRPLPLRSAFINLLTAARCLWQLRENTHFDATRILPVLRRTFLELGRRLVMVGVMANPEDVFHLKFGELERIGGTWPPAPELANELRAIMLRRKERRAGLGGKPVVDPRFYRQPAPSGDTLLRGTPGSPGIAEGPVRVIHDSSEFSQLRAGEVLVAPYTNPAWTPLFQRAAAVVVDGGGTGSHAAIVAREYGIPAVMGTIDGTQHLVDGQPVRVDGNRGLVLRAS